MPISAAVRTMRSSSVCPKCGIIRKSSKMSCCAHGGSWFGNCGGADNTNYGHTWYEGIRACKVRESKAAMGQRLHASQPKSNIYSDDTSTVMNSNAVMASVLAATLAPMLTATSFTVPANGSLITSDAQPIVHGTGTAIFKSVTGTNVTIAHTSVNTSTLKPTIPQIYGASRVNLTSTLPANRRISLQSDAAIIKSINNPSSQVAIFTITSSHSSASNTECEFLSDIITCINIILYIVYWY